MPLQVLIIEDDLDAQANLRDILELDGYAVEVAASVAETLQDRDWGAVFAVILDRRLPDGTAEELLPELRKRAPQTTVVVVTGHADLEAAVAVIRHGVADFITKPVNPDLLLASLRRIARLKQAEERTLQAERLAAIGEMVASLAHESRNALQRIQIGIELLQPQLADNLEGTADLKLIEDAADGLHHLLEDVRGYAGPLRLEKRDSSLADTWRLAWSHLKSHRTGRECALIEHLEGLDLTCQIDFDRLEQVFRNLFENALAACEEACTIELTCEETELDGQPAVSVVVSDNGPGLNADQRQHLFDAFYTTKRSGTGLGMAIAKRIVETHEGQIEIVDSAAGGAAFRICLPRCLSRQAMN